MPSLPTFPTDRLHIRPWTDPVIDRLGHDPRSAYVETYWPGILGPSACWLLRRLADGMDAGPDGFDLDLPDTADATHRSCAPWEGSASSGWPASAEPPPSRSAATCHP